MLRRQGQLAPEEAERVTGRGGNGPERKAAAAPADRTRAPRDALVRGNARDIAGVVAGQRRAVRDLHPELGHPSVILQRQPLLYTLADLGPAAERVAAELQP